MEMTWPLLPLCRHHDNGGCRLVIRSPASDQCNNKQDWVQQSSSADFRLPLRMETRDVRQESSKFTAITLKNHHNLRKTNPLPSLHSYRFLTCT